LFSPKPEDSYVLHTDWSITGISAVLGQRDSVTGEERPIAYISRSLNMIDCMPTVLCVC